MQASLLVLAGGGSRRMGRPKAWLEVGDTFLLRYVVDRLAPAFSEVMVSFAEPEQLEEPLPYRIVFDRKRSAGPLAGLEAGLLAARNELIFAVACDMPYVTQDFAQMAIVAARRSDAALVRIDGRPEPVCGAYGRSALPAITEALDAGRLKTADAIALLDVTWLEGLDPDIFRSLNTPEDLDRFHAEFASQR
ncbi:MAG TPA: molybdenum cofactor guanylyltransferase [Verrucomicrobiae bacterium]|jgi:molybdopterin-guanine dinucleotide biosynthesis protein A|nr:molybdenum cofactor guanylyltransferase [Verrucomicrobiae bacterium]